ncbi:MAG: nucleotidyltransferase domain-containing protein [Chitinophagales bacterium]
MQYINQYKKEIQALCKKHNVKNLYVFGSHARGDYTPESDVDLMVEFEGVSLYDYNDNYYDFFQRMEKVLRKKGDLVQINISKTLI